MSNKDQHLKISETTLSDLNNDSVTRYEGPLTTNEDATSSRNLSNNLNSSISFVSTSSDNSRIAISVYGNDIKLDSPLKIGKSFSFLYVKGFPVITLGPEYYMSILLLTITNAINLLFIYFIYPRVFFIFKYIGLTIFLVQITSQIYTTLINPGIPHKNNYISDSVMQIIYKNMKLSGLTFDKYRICKICNILVNKDQDVIHCDECNICVEGMDHHCFWIGKCIGKNNLMSFNVFLLSTVLFIIFCIITVIAFALMLASAA